MFRKLAVVLVLFSLISCGGGGGGGSDTPAPQTPTPTPAPVTNSAPQLSSPASFSIEENSLIGITLVANDVDGDALTFSITGGADASFFTLDPVSGVLSSNNVFNFEIPADITSDNDYHVDISVSDSMSTSNQTLVISITDLNEIPIAMAGDDISHLKGERLSLNCAGSNDPEQASLTYEWVQTAGSSLSLSDPTTCNPSVQLPNTETNFSFELSVSDGVNPRATDTVNVTSRNYIGQQLVLSSNPFRAHSNHIEDTGSDILTRIEIFENIAVTANSTLTKLVMRDISALPSITTLSTFQLPNPAVDYRVDGSFVYVTQQDLGLLIIDISDPRNPVEAATLTDPVNNVGFLYIEKVDQFLYVYDFTNPGSIQKLRVIDVSNPAAPQIVNTFSLTRRIDYFTKADSLLIGKPERGASSGSIFDLTDPINLSYEGPVLPAQIDSTTEIIGETIGDGNFIYTSTTNKFFSIDVSDPTNPTIASELDLQAHSSILFRENQMALANNTISLLSLNGVVINIDVSDPNAIRHLGSVPLEDQSFAIGAKGDYTISLYQKEIDVLDNTKSTNNHLLLDALISGNEIFIDDTVAYTSGTFTFSSIDISDLSNLSILGETQFERPLESPIRKSDRYLYFGSGKVGGGSEPYGLAMVDASSPNILSVINRHPSANRVFDLVVVGSNHLYVLDRPTGLLIYDVAGGIPNLINTYPIDVTKAEKLSLSNNHLYITHRTNVIILDVSDPQNPQLVNTVPIQPCSITSNLETAGNLLIHSCVVAVNIYDIGNIDPVLVKNYFANGTTIQDAKVHNGKIFLAGANDLQLGVSGDGIRELDISDLSYPIVSKFIGLPGAPNHPSVSIGFKDGAIISTGKRFQTTDLSESISITRHPTSTDPNLRAYTANWIGKAYNDARCIVTVGTCNVIGIDSSSRTVEVEWDAQGFGDQTIAVLVGDSWGYIAAHDKVALGL